MRLLKKRWFKIAVPCISVLLVVSLMFAYFPIGTSAQLPALDPEEVRQAVLQMGMGSLSTVILNDPPGLSIFIRLTPPVATPTSNPPMPAPPQALIDLATERGIPVQRAALLVLGKAFLFDQQVGSDGNACASCHFIAGTDNRIVNTLNPSSRNTDPVEAVTWNPTASGANPGPNYTLTAADFPFHQLADPLETNYMKREVTFDTDDVVGSIGAFHVSYAGSPAPDYSLPNATGTYDTPGPATVDPVFNINGKNTRSNGPRQAATYINAVFNFRNFWDGRADNNFNGLNMHGIKDLNAFMYWNAGGTLIRDLVGGITDGALASQAVAPPNSETSDEMAFGGRTMRDLGRKMLRVTSTPATPGGFDSVTGLPLVNIIPLGAQMVSPTDSLLGRFVNSPDVNGGRGLNVSYMNLIQWAFLPQYWDATGLNNTVLLTPGGFHLMEENFAAFWGLAIQEFETILVSDQTPFDRFMDGDNTALTQRQLRGLLTYINTEAAVLQPNPLLNNINFGACQLCHSGPELTENTLVNVPAKGFVTLDMTVKMDHNRELAIVAPASNFDVGFSNVGSRPNREDMAIGATILGGIPLSFTRQGQMNFLWIALNAMLPPFVAKPNPMRGSNIDGAFKIPSLRNIELQGPYFHHGGSLTLKQAVEFYARHGDFADVNDPNIDVGLAMVQNVGHEDADLIVEFLLALTDERVRWEMAPFDHPQLFIPNGHPTTGDHPVLGASYYPDEVFEYPAVGSAGRSTLPTGSWPGGNSPLPNFLGISSTPVAGPNNDHFDP